MRQKIKEIVTYHTDEGTSGYLLSEEQIDKILDLIHQEIEKAIPKKKLYPDGNLYPSGKLLKGKVEYGILKETGLPEEKLVFDHLETIEIDGAIYRLVKNKRGTNKRGANGRFV